MIRRVESDLINVELTNESLVIDTPDGSITLSVDEVSDLRDMLDVMWSQNNLYRFTAGYKNNQELTPRGLLEQGQDLRYGDL